MDTEKLNKISEILHEWDYSTTEYEEEDFTKLSRIEKEIDDLIKKFA